jgi:hypothetical protein
MATQPPPGQEPAQPLQAPPEVGPPGHDVDVPAPASPPPIVPPS